jgi:hypothetical protein
MDERKSHYTPAQLGTFVKVQLLAGRQTHRGRFRSVDALRRALPADYARHVPFLVDQGDLVTLPDGTLYLDGWDEWQEGDVTVRERMARLRNRHRHPTVTPTVTNGVTQPSPTATRSSVGVGVEVDVPPDGGTSTPPARPNGVDPDVVELQLLAEQLTQQPYVMQNVHSGLGQKAVALMRKHGRPKVEAEWHRITEAEGGMPTLRQLVLGTDNVLNAVPVPVAMTREQRAEAEREALLEKYGRRSA